MLHRSLAVVSLLALLLSTGVPEASAASPPPPPPDASWVPSWVIVESGQSADGTRYLRMQFAWSDASGFARGSTYEQDFFLDNYAASPLGPGTYLTRDRTVTQLPRVVSWRSNLPAAYLDTRLGDGNDEIAYTIGSGNAAAIRPGIVYAIEIETAPGDADRDSARLAAQLGHQDPRGCESTWCSVGDDSVDIFPAWTIPVPGTIGTGTPPNGTPGA